MTQPVAHHPDPTIRALLENKRVIVCCGAGGVGKTTVSASLALAAARMGRRVLVVTIDPSKRLAETLGVDRNPPEPVAVSEEILASVGVHPPGSLAAWMLDPKLVTTRVVKAIARTESEAESILQNRLYRHITAMIAGMQEYTAVEALYAFVKDDAYDLIVLDTPPSRNALQFLDAPKRAVGFLDGRIFTLFLPGEGNVVRRAATRLVERVLDVAFGEELRRELQFLLEALSRIFGSVKSNAEEMQRFFRTDEAAFLLVTTPAAEALEEAEFFAQKVKNLDMGVAGYVLNSSLDFLEDKVFPSPELMDGQVTEDAKRALAKMAVLAKAEQEEAEIHRTLLERLRGQAKDGIARALPRLPEAVSDLTAVKALADRLVVRVASE